MYIEAEIKIRDINYDYAVSVKNYFFSCIMVLPVTSLKTSQIRFCNWHVVCFLWCFFFCFWRHSPSGPPPPQWARASSFRRFLDHTQRCTTVGRTPLDEWLARRRDLYLTTHNNHDRHTSMPSVGFEPTILADERPQTNNLYSVR